MEEATDAERGGDDDIDATRSGDDDIEQAEHNWQRPRTKACSSRGPIRGRRPSTRSEEDGEQGGEESKRENSTASIARRRRRRGGSDDGDAQCTLPVDISEVEKFEKYVCKIGTWRASA